MDVFKKENEIQDKTNLKIRDGDLEIMWAYKSAEAEARDEKTFGIVCRCGNRELLLAKDCIRCHACGRGHTWDSFLILKEQGSKLARMSGGNTKGTVRQWQPPMPINPFALNMPGLDISKIYKEAKREIRYLTCKKCSTTYVWTKAHRLNGVSPPLVEVNGEEMCQQCLRKISYS